MTIDQGAEPAIRDSENRAIGARYKLTNSCATWKRLHVIYFKFSAARSNGTKYPDSEDTWRFGECTVCGINRIHFLV